MDLEEFAEQDKGQHLPGRRCRICTELSPEHLEQLHASHPKRGYAVMARWLKSEGYELKDFNVSRHFQHGHHE